MTPENLIFSTEKTRATYSPRNFFRGFLHDENKILHAHSEFNFSSEYEQSNTLYINTLTTFHAYVRGQVYDIFGDKYLELYEHQPKNIPTIRHSTQKMISEIIKIAPEYVDYIVIPYAEKYEKFLQNHYQNIGENLKQIWIITRVWNHRYNSIFYKIAK